jgi:ABC-type lipoprotein export system ATPase subunit
LTLEHVSSGYSRGGRWTSVLADVSLSIDTGEILAILGARLAGKSTLLQIAAGMQSPDSGTVTLGGVDLGTLPDRRRTRLLGHEIVWIDRQGPGLDVEVTRFVGWPLVLHGRGRREGEEAAARALERVGARNCAGRRWGDLSNWQRVLVGLARGFAGSPRLVVIDDLLDALGQQASEEAFDLVRSLLEEATQPCGVLMSASDFDSGRYADRVFSLTRSGALSLLSGPVAAPEGEIIPFPAPHLPFNAPHRERPGGAHPGDSRPQHSGFRDGSQESRLTGSS